MRIIKNVGGSTNKHFSYVSLRITNLQVTNFDIYTEYYIAKIIRDLYKTPITTVYNVIIHNW